MVGCCFHEQSPNHQVLVIARQSTISCVVATHLASRLTIFSKNVASFSQCAAIEIDCFLLYLIMLALKKRQNCLQSGN